MDPRSPHPPSPRQGRASRAAELGDGRVRVGPWRSPRRLLPVALLPVLVYVALWTLVTYGLGAAGCRDARPVTPLLGAGAAGSQAASAAAETLVESTRFALPPSDAGNRFDSGWERRELHGREVLVPATGTGRLQVVNLGEEVPRTLTLDLSPEELPEGERLSVRAGDRELAQATLRAASLPLAVRLPEDLPVGQVPLDLVFAPGVAAGRSALPALFGASLSPALPAGGARVEGADVVMVGNCLVYLHCRLVGKEALEGTFVPPADARPGQRFELSVERPDGTPIRRFSWRPSFWNRLRGARRFQLPLRGARGPVRVRLIARAGDAGGPPGRWRALGLADVTGEILTPGQGQ